MLLGPSGCGKTTTLRAIAGLEEIDSGDILIDGKPVQRLEASERDIAFVFQLFALYPHLTAFDNIAFPLRATRRDARRRWTRKVAGRRAGSLQITHLLKLRPSRSSGGDMQRVAIGRALVRRPKALLDGRADRRARRASCAKSMRAELKRLHIENDATTVYVTHDQVEAMALADRIAIMNEGVLQQVGAPSRGLSQPGQSVRRPVRRQPGDECLESRRSTTAASARQVVVGDGDTPSTVPAALPAALAAAGERRTAHARRPPRGDPASRLRAVRPGYVRIEAHIIEPLGAYDIVDLKVGGQFLRARTASGFVPRGRRRRSGRSSTRPRLHFFDPAHGPVRSNLRLGELRWRHVRLDGVTKSFGAHTAVADLTLEIDDGEFFVLLGPTGAGKTTTLRLIAGLEKPNAGRIASIGNEDVAGWSAAERDVALVLQYYSLYPRYTVRQNLEFPLKSRVRRLDRAEIDERIARAAKTLRIEHLLDRKTDRLSGGEMQRVSIGRAIVREPRDLPDGRAAVQPRRQAARGAARRAQGPADEARRHLPVRHPRPDRGDVDGRQASASSTRAGSSQVGTPHEIYNRAARRLRRRLRRLAGDEPGQGGVPQRQGDGAVRPARGPGQRRRGAAERATGR